MRAPLVFTEVEKHYGGLRPLRVSQLEVNSARVTMLVGFDRPSAEMFVNLTTGTTLPDKGRVVALGRETSTIADSTEWLAFAERFGLVSERSVLLEAMTVEQNLALPFDLNLDAISPDAQARADALAREVGLEHETLASRVGEASPLTRARLLLARALAFDPEMLLLEHASAPLNIEDAAAFALAIQAVSAGRQLTTVGLVADEKFAKASGGQLLYWQPATGAFYGRKTFRFW